jgi:RNA polymerase sigma factor (sigma-70 family)
VVLTCAALTNVADQPADWDARAGGDPSIEFVYAQYSGFCLSVAMRVLTNRHQAEDAVQEAFLAYSRGPARFDATKGTLATWLATLTYRRAVDIVRRERARERPAARAADDQRHLAVPADPEDQVMAALDAAHVQASLLQLDSAKRRIIYLAYYLGHTQSEIATITGTPLGTVKTRNRDALRQLRRTMVDTR